MSPIRKLPAFVAVAALCVATVAARDCPSPTIDPCTSDSVSQQSLTAAGCSACVDTTCGFCISSGKCGTTDGGEPKTEFFCDDDDNWVHQSGSEPSCALLAGGTEADPCLANSGPDCSSCKSTTCGWCSESGMCVANDGGIRNNPDHDLECDNDSINWFFDDACPARCSSKSTCGTCLSEYGCFWCSSSNTCKPTWEECSCGEEQSFWHGCPVTCPASDVTVTTNPCDGLTVDLPGFASCCAADDGTGEGNKTLSVLAHIIDTVNPPGDPVAVDFDLEVRLTPCTQEPLADILVTVREPVMSSQNFEDVSAAVDWSTTVEMGTFSTDITVGFSNCGGSLLFTVKATPKVSGVSAPGSPFTLIDQAVSLAGFCSVAHSCTASATPSPSLSATPSPSVSASPDPCAVGDPNCRSCLTGVGSCGWCAVDGRCVSATNGRCGDGSSPVITGDEETCCGLATSSGCAACNADVNSCGWCAEASQCVATSGTACSAAVAADCPSCFPGHSMVALEDGSQKPYAEVKVGDMVLAVDATGNTFYDRVFRLGFQEPDQLTTYVRLETASGKALHLSPGHFLHVNTCCSLDTMVPAAQVAVGDNLFGVQPGSAPQPDAVVSIDKNTFTGAFNAHVRNANIVVDGLAASHFTTETTWAYKSWAPWWYAVVDGLSWE